MSAAPAPATLPGTLPATPELRHQFSKEPRSLVTHDVITSFFFSNRGISPNSYFKTNLSFARLLPLHSRSSSSRPPPPPLPLLGSSCRHRCVAWSRLLLVSVRGRPYSLSILAAPPPFAVAPLVVASATPPLLPSSVLPPKLFESCYLH
ncbi:hypothetical protein VIGAN_08265000 [Vigna angularis var. angularis]|uniref:Uncharacterized protein n=1 Tax=Vigna angularis var. angularis TaxID=157739 RepID=A0A0S3SSN6_PHAAN|nr:hypothetical protein VIGAN_08265000 [Vigna angularis var. angularis]